MSIDTNAVNMRLLLSLLFLVFLCYADYLGFRRVGAQYPLLSPTDQPRVALVAVLTIVAALLLLSAIRSGAREQTQQGLLVQRYRLCHLALGALRQEEVSPTLLLRIDNGLALLGSRAVIQAFRKLRDGSSSQGVGSPPPTELLTKLIKAMRADLGQCNFEIRTASKALRQSKMAWGYLEIALV